MDYYEQKMVIMNGKGTMLNLIIAKCSRSG